MSRTLWAVFVALLLPGLLAWPHRDNSDDPLRGLQWNLDMIEVDHAWRHTDGDGVVVAVIDSGLDTTHPDFDHDRLVPGTSIYAGCRPSCGSGSWEDVNDGVARGAHGTHVAGIIAAARKNGRGLTGVAPKASIMPIQVFGNGPADMRDVARAIWWATEHGADVINMSLGDVADSAVLHSTGLENSGIAEAVDYAREMGVVLVAAAYNDYVNPICGYPAFEPGIICVTSVDKRGMPATYSNRGFAADKRVVAAPGGDRVYERPASHGGKIAALRATCVEGVLSTIPPLRADKTMAHACGFDQDGPAYGIQAGTSMAAPAVAGIVALLRSLGCTGPEAEHVVLETAEPPVTLSPELLPAYGRGLVNARRAVISARGGMCREPSVS